VLKNPLLFFIEFLLSPGNTKTATPFGISSRTSFPSFTAKKNSGIPARNSYWLKQNITANQITPQT
jgi:hypothetical protein